MAKKLEEIWGFLVTQGLSHFLLRVTVVAGFSGVQF